MTPIELCEPLFLKICELNRMSRFQMSQDYMEVRSQLKALLDETTRAAGRDPKLSAQMAKLKLALVFFVDSMMVGSKLPFAGKWRDNSLAAELYNELAGDEEFFELLQQTLDDPSDEAAERLAVFHTMLGLGFVGARAGQPAELRNHMNQIGARIRPYMDVDYKSRLCPDAYKHVDTRNLIEPPEKKVTLSAIICVAAIVATLVTLYGFYASAIDSLNTSVSQILKSQ